MNTTYEIVEETIVGKKVKSLKRTDSDGTVWSIPMDPTNGGYKMYLEWLEEQKLSK